MSAPTVLIVREPTVVTMAAPGPQGTIGPGVAASVTFEPTGTVGSTNVQAAIVEVAAEAGIGSYVFSQSPADDVWTISHNMGRRPTWEVYDNSSPRRRQYPDRDDPDQNTTVFDFNGVPVAGMAIGA